MRPLAIFAVTALVIPASAEPVYATPDFAGVWKRSYRINETFDPPANGPGPVVQDPRYPAVNHDGVPRRTLTSAERKKVIRFTQNWVADLSNPILQPKTRIALGKIGEQELAGFPHPELQTRCLPSGTPSVLNLLDHMMIVQTPAEVLFIYERDHHVRHIYLNQSHSSIAGHSWWGESIGHYEGDTLVVDTTGENDKTDVDRFGTPHSDQIHVVERYRRIHDGGNIEVNVTVEDPVAFTTPWSASAHYVADRNNDFLEIVCAESQRIFWPGRQISLPVANSPDF
jgi:hypothetical protein